MMNPTALPDELVAKGLTLQVFMTMVMCAAVLVFLGARILHALARKLAHGMQRLLGEEHVKQRAQLTLRLASASLVMLIFLSALGFLYAPALVIVLGLIAVVSLVPRGIIESRVVRFMARLLGVAGDIRARYRLLGSGLFLIFFMLLIGLVFQLDAGVSVALLIVVLLGRRFFQEYVRLRISLLDLQNLSAVGSLE